MSGTTTIASTASIVLSLGSPVGPVTRLCTPGPLVAPFLNQLQQSAASTMSGLKIEAPSKLAVEPRWASSINHDAAKLAKLAAGWDGHGAKQIDAAVLYSAVNEIKHALDGLPQATSPYLVPVANGGLQIEWHEEHGELEYSLNPDGSRFFWGQNHLSGAEFEGDDGQAIALLYRWAPWVASPVRHVPDVPPSQNNRLIAIAA